MTEIPDLRERRAVEQARIRALLNSMKAEEEAKLKGGENAVAWVNEELCIGCDQCTIVCDDDAIELYDTPLASPIMDVDDDSDCITDSDLVLDHNPLPRI